MFYFVALCLAVVVLVVAFIISADHIIRLPWVSGLHKKCVVITGCDSGFGNALAKSLYRRGVFVFAGCYTENGAKTLTKETGERLKTFRLDVSNTESIEEGLKFVKENRPEGTELWGLVNNAGVLGQSGPVEILSREDMMAVMQVNCFGMMEMVRIFLPLLKKSRGRIVNTCSIAGIFGAPTVTPYIASKFAMIGCSNSLRLEKAMWGIKVASIYPGFFKTPFVSLEKHNALMKQKWENMTPDMRRVLDEEYGQEYFDKMVDTHDSEVDKLAQTNLNLVVEVFEHALFAKCPRAHYYPGTDSKVLLCVGTVFPWIPDMVVSWLIRKNIPKALQK